MRMRGYARRRKEEEIISGKLRGAGRGDRSIHDELKRRHFSEEGYIESFARPFFGAAFLDRSLDTSARALLLTLKTLASGDTVGARDYWQRTFERERKNSPTFGSSVNSCTPCPVVSTITVDGPYST